MHCSLHAEQSHSELYSVFFIAPPDLLRRSFAYSLDPSFKCNLQQNSYSIYHFLSTVADIIWLFNKVRFTYTRCATINFIEHVFRFVERGELSAHQTKNSHLIGSISNVSVNTYTHKHLNCASGTFSPSPPPPPPPLPVSAILNYPALTFIWNRGLFGSSPYF